MQDGDIVKLEGRRLEQHLIRMHGMYGLGDDAAKEWHALDHKLGARHNHKEEAKTR